MERCHKLVISSAFYVRHPRPGSLRRPQPNTCGPVHPHVVFLPLPRQPHLMCYHEATIHVVASPCPSAAALGSTAPGMTDDVGVPVKGDCDGGIDIRTVFFHCGSFTGV